MRGIYIKIVTGLFFSLGAIYAQESTNESYSKGVEFAVQGNFVEARQEFEKALQAEHYYPSAKFYLKVVEDVLEQQIERETAINLFQGIFYTLNSQYDLAISYYTKAIEINPKYAEAYNERGVIYDGKGQYDLAISDYTMAIELNPKFAIAYNNRGGAYDDKGQYDQAISDYTSAIEINPNLSEVYNNRAFAYYTKGQNDQAISDYTRAIEIDPNFTLAYNNRGLAYYNEGQYDNSVSDFNKAIEINPNFILAYINRGLLYFEKLGNMIDGCADFKKACELGNCENYNLVKQKGYCP